MKNVMPLALISLCVLITVNSSAQQTDEATIRKLENAEREAILKGDTPNAKKTVKRRFTNIWMKEKDIWKLTVRQATIISVN